MLFLIFPILEIFSIDMVFWISLDNVLYKYIQQKKVIRKVKILSNKTPNRSRFCLQSCSSSRAFVPLASILQPSFSKAFLALCWVSSASHLLSSLAPAFASIFLHLKYGDFHTRAKTSFRKTLKYGENETNHIFTIDNTNVLKKFTTLI